MSDRRPTDELWERTRRLDAERLRPERPAPPPVTPLGELIALLDRLLTDPGPPDRTVQDLDSKETPR